MTLEKIIKRHHLHEKTYALVFLNGKFLPEYSSREILDAIKVQDSQNAIHENHLLLKTILEKKEDLSCATNSGAFLKIEENTTIEKPIHLMFFLKANPDNKELNTQNFIVAKEGSSATFIEEHIACDEEKYCSNIKSYFLAEDGSKIACYKLQKQNVSSGQNITINAIIKNKAEINFGHFFFNASTKNNITITLHEEAKCDLKGFCLLNENQKSQYNLHIDHLEAKSSSHSLYKCTVNDEAQSAFQCRVKVHGTAPKSVAFLKNQNLILSKDAEAFTKPELEIYNDDVKCNHGATCGDLDNKALFYLRSRGISQEKARALLVAAFMREVIATISNPTIREYINLCLGNN